MRGKVLKKKWGKGRKRHLKVIKLTEKYAMFETTMYVYGKKYTRIVLPRPISKFMGFKNKEKVRVIIRKVKS